jgi:hypothetical protein
MAQYNPDFPTGSVVRIKDRGNLESFKKDWAYHHPLKSKQLPYAGTIGRVAETSAYHGGDILYKIEKMPGLWHEQCLEAAVKEPIQPPEPMSGLAPGHGSS